MRLIDAGALRAWLVKAGRFLKLQDDKRTASHAIGKVIDHVDKIPAVDAVPVVRCRDCEYIYDGCGYLACVKSGTMLYPDENDYCSRGQRRGQSADVRNMGQFAGGGKTGGQNDADQH